MQDLVVARKEFPTGQRNMLLMALWSFAFELHRAILCLMANRFFGAAQSLIRTLVEVTVRAHVVIMCSDDDVKQILADTYKTRFQTIGQEIDTFFGLEGLFQHFLTRAREALHSYTHAGMMQLGRRFSGSDLTPNYRDGELIETIQVSTSAIFMVNNLATKHLGFKEESDENSRLYEEWGKRGQKDG